MRGVVREDRLGAARMARKYWRMSGVVPARFPSDQPFAKLAGGVESSSWAIEWARRREAAGASPCPPAGTDLMRPRRADDLHLRHGRPPSAITASLRGDVIVDAGTRHAAGRILRQVRGRPVSALALTHAHP